METDMRPTPIGRFTDTPSYEELQREVARLRLTDAEREAVDAGADALESIAANDNDGRIRAALLIAANTLRGFLKRTG
jgi:hypothetical protein